MLDPINIAIFIIYDITALPSTYLLNPINIQDTLPTNILVYPVTNILYNIYDLVDRASAANGVGLGLARECHPHH